jgi:undecaprenyl-diphosphatase
MLEALKKLDIALLHLINREWTAPWVDAFLPWLRYKQIWYPFYLALIVFALVNLGRKAGWWIGGSLLSVGIADLLSSRLVKHSFQRLRPCRDPELLDLILLRIPHCSGGYSFTSSHAANHFALAAFLFVTLQPVLGRITAFVFLWAALVGYAQVYVGVHYPFDVLGGMAIGLFVGSVVGRGFNKKWGLHEFALPGLGREAGRH